MWWWPPPLYPAHIQLESTIPKSVQEKFAFQTAQKSYSAALTQSKRNADIGSLDHLLMTSHYLVEKEDRRVRSCSCNCLEFSRKASTATLPPATASPHMFSSSRRLRCCLGLD